jgi:mono/diheme cytochrome c family protein
LLSHGRSRQSASAALAIAAATLVAFGVSRPQAHTRTTQVTWTVDVEPIIRSRCVTCHRSDGFGPMPLATYQDAKPWAKAIREQVLSGAMPPWSAVGGYGDFINDASLSAVEMEVIARWADGATPLGPDMPLSPRAETAPAERSRERRIDLPTVTVTGGSIERFALPLSSEEDQWIWAWRAEPGDRRLLEQAVLTVGDTPIGTWTPLDGRIDYPRGVAQRLPRGSTLMVTLRYRKSSEPRTDRSAVVLELGPRPARELQHRTLTCGAQAVDRDIDVLAVTPRPAAAGDSIEIVAYGPRAEVEPLCVVSRFQPEYAVTYRMRTPLRLGRGTRLDVRSSSDGCAGTIDYLSR